MREKIVRKQVVKILVLGVAAWWMLPAAAQNRAEGKLDVDGKPVAITQVYAYAKEGFFDK